MTSKNPFEYEGLSISLQGGVMHFNNDYDRDLSIMKDFSFRYGKKISDKVAFKIFVEGSAANVRREAKSSTLTREETSSLLRFPANKKVFLSMVDKAFK